MADHSIRFYDPEIRAILRELENPGMGKTQTRRVINPQPKTFVVEETGKECDVYPFQVEGESRMRIALGDKKTGGVLLDQDL